MKIDDRIIRIEENFRKVTVKIKQKGREILEDFNITPPQFNVLLHLIEEGELTIGELSSRMYLACSTVTDLIDRMEKAELVVRVKDQKDRRVVRVRVLEKGNRLLEGVLLNRRQYLASILTDEPEALIACIDESFIKLNEKVDL
jgi:DNA-binding MarR family transcriptional regulator